MDMKTRLLSFRVLKFWSARVETIKSEPSDPFYWDLIRNNHELFQNLVYYTIDSSSSTVVLLLFVAGETCMHTKQVFREIWDEYCNKGRVRTPVCGAEKANPSIPPLSSGIY